MVGLVEDGLVPERRFPSNLPPKPSPVLGERLAAAVLRDESGWSAISAKWARSSKSVNHLFDGRNCVCVEALAEVYDLVCDLLTVASERPLFAN